jgi:hypothetical protein
MQFCCLLLCEEFLHVDFCPINSVVVTITITLSPGKVEFINEHVM